MSTANHSRSPVVRKVHDGTKPGTKHGMLTILGYPFRIGKANRSVVVVCECECGAVVVASRWHLVNRYQSCGCQRIKNVSAVLYRHGFAGRGSEHPLLSVWKNMRARCYQPARREYRNYGGRGIGICAEWLQNPGQFIEWGMAHGYQPGLQIDRRDNNAGYSPENCRWVTCKANLRNKRTTRLVTAWGETKCFADWAEDPRCSVHKTTLGNRIDNGWLPEDAIGMPRQCGNYGKVRNLETEETNSKGA